MTYGQMVLLAFAISLDSLALMIVEGAMTPKIWHNELLKAGLLISGWQTLAISLGNSLYPLALSNGLDVHHFIPRISLRLLAGLLFIGLGVHMFKRGWEIEYINEQRQNHLDANRILMIALITGFDAFVTGIGLSFVQMNVTTEFFVILLISFLSVIIGAYIGYLFGYEKKHNAHRLSSVIYFVAATSLIVR